MLNGEVEFLSIIEGIAASAVSAKELGDCFVIHMTNGIGVVSQIRELQIQGDFKELLFLNLADIGHPVLKASLLTFLSQVSPS